MTLALTGTRWVVLVDWEIAPGDVVRLSSESYCTKPTDDPPNIEYTPAVRSIPWSLSASAIMHRTGGGASPLTAIELDRRVDALMNRVLRDNPVTIYFVEPGAAYSSKVRVASAFGDRVESATRTRMRIKLRTVIDKMKRPISVAFDTGDLIGQMKAVCFGDVEHTFGQSFSGVNKEISLSADSFYGLTAVYAGGVSTADYVRSTNIYFDGVDMGSVVGKFSFGVRGVMWARLQMVQNSNLANWTGIYPDDFTVVENLPDSGVARVGTFNLVRIHSGGSLASISQNTLTPGNTYSAAVTCASAITGALQVMCGAAVLLTINAPGRYRIGFVATATDFTIRRSALEAASDIIISEVSCVYVEQTNRIDHAVYFILHNRMLFDPLLVDSASVNAVASAAPWRIGFQVDGQQDLHVTLRQALDNVCGDAWADLQGTIRIGRLRDPAGETPVARFTDVQIIGDVTYRQDEAPGLRNRLRYRYNHAVHGDADLVTTDPARRLLLKTEYLTATSTVAPSQHYAQVVTGEPRQSWIRQEDHALAQIEHECRLLSGETPALWVEFETLVDPRVALSDLQPFAPIACPAPDFGDLAVLGVTISGDLLSPYTAKVLGWSPARASTLLLDDGGALVLDDGAGLALVGA